MKKLISASIILILLITFIGCSKMPKITVTQGETMTPPPSAEQKVEDEVIKNAEYFEKAGMDLVDNEKVGEIHMGMSREDLFQLLGNPENIGATPEQWGADGRYHITYLYEQQLESYFEFTSSSEDEGFILINANFGSKFPGKTSRDVGIGSSSDDVIAAYKDEYNELQSIENNTKEKQTQRGNQMLIMGDLLSGLCFYVDPQTNLVSSILLGTTVAE